MFFLIISVIAWAFWSVCLNKASGLPSLWAAIIAYIPGFILSIYVLFSTTNFAFLKSTNSLWALGAGISGTIGSLCYLEASHSVKGSVVTSVSAMYPILSVFIFLALGENVSMKQIIGIVIAIISITFFVIPSGRL
jgi:drug/metabolite transporter (DMT)-like permease